MLIFYNRNFNMILLFIVSAFGYTLQYDLPRVKRETAGALDIVNDDRAFHTDIKPDDDKVPHVKSETLSAVDIVNNEPAIHMDIGRNDVKICTKTKPNIIPSSIESGTVFKVTPPKMSKSRRMSNLKSIDIVRAINRVTLLATMITVGMIELYPILSSLYDYVYEYFVG